MDETDKTTPSDSPPETDPAHLDWYLGVLVSTVNGSDAELPITLFVRGLIISGRLVSGHKYFEAIGDQVLGHLGGESPENTKVADLFKLPAEVYKKKPVDDESSEPTFIHLRDARVFGAGQNPIPQEGVWWRGRLSSVDGFIFGGLSTEPPGDS